MSYSRVQRVVLFGGQAGLRLMAMALVLMLLSMAGCAGSDVESDGALDTGEQVQTGGKELPPDFVRLLDEQLEDGRSIAIRGSVSGETSFWGKPTGWVMVTLQPSQAERQLMEVGDSYETPIIGVAKVTNGTFEVTLDPETDVLPDGVNDVVVNFIEAESHQTATLGFGQLQVNRTEGGRNISVLNIDLPLPGAPDSEDSEMVDPP